MAFGAHFSYTRQVKKTPTGFHSRVRFGPRDGLRVSALRRASFETNKTQPRLRAPTRDSMFQSLTKSLHRHRPAIPSLHLARTHTFLQASNQLVEPERPEEQPIYQHMRLPILKDDLHISIPLMPLTLFVFVVFLSKILSHMFIG